MKNGISAKNGLTYEEMLAVSESDGNQFSSVDPAGDEESDCDAVKSHEKEDKRDLDNIDSIVGGN